MTLKEMGAGYSLSVSYLRRHLHDEDRPLPFHRCGRAIRIERADAARWFASFKDTEADEGTARRAQFRRDFT